MAQATGGGHNCGLEPGYLVLSVLCYVEKIEEEDGTETKDWVAHCLEMDIKGRGDTLEEAEETLKGMVVAQISFARYMDEPGLLYRPAEERYFEIFRGLAAQYLRSYPHEPEMEEGYRVCHVPFSAVEGEVDERYART
jgi:hypothetical protein